MIDFIYNLFKSEDVKIDEEYQKYKAKYGDKVKILRKGDKYGVSYTIKHPVKNERPISNSISFIYSLNEAKEKYVKECKNYDFNTHPVREV